MINTLTLSDEDYEVAMEALHKHWNEQKRQKAITMKAITIQAARLKTWIGESVTEIGLEETKALIREANRDLRMRGEDAC